MPAAAAESNSIAVQPVGRRESVKCPTGMPATSVSDPVDGAWDGEPTPGTRTPPATVQPNARRVITLTAPASVLLGHLPDDVHRMIGGARRPMFGIDVAGPVEAAQLLEDERIVDLAGARLEASRVVADLDDLDQLVLHAVPQADNQVALRPLQMVDVEAHLDVGMIDFLDHRKGFDAAIERASWLRRVHAERL